MHVYILSLSWWESSPRCWSTCKSGASWSWCRMPHMPIHRKVINKVTQQSWYKVSVWYNALYKLTWPHGCSLLFGCVHIWLFTRVGERKSTLHSYIAWGCGEGVQLWRLSGRWDQTLSEFKLWSQINVKFLWDFSQLLIWPNRIVEFKIET